MLMGRSGKGCSKKLEEEAKLTQVSKSVEMGEGEERDYLLASCYAAIEVEREVEEGRGVESGSLREKGSKMMEER